tara:strand:- start:291 stop:452 length:162 start_codon:yes stop_codon:yes gene_type:complete
MKFKLEINMSNKAFESPDELAKKDDDMDGPLSWALHVRVEVNELLEDLEGGEG